MSETTAEQVLARQWAEYAAQAAADDGTDPEVRARLVALFGEPDPYEEVVAPFGDGWPGLAPPREQPWDTDPDELAAHVLADVRAAEKRRVKEYERDARQGIVGRRPAFALDRPYRAAEAGPLLAARGVAEGFPYGGAEFTAVLASWESRFGTRLVGLDHDTVILSVAAPPRTTAEAEHVAAEHFAFSSDTIVQEEDEILTEYAANQLVTEPVWRFWWD
ncbi:DUF4253 domain-containing protein [Streptomyces sp. NRRL F-5123]|uniref:DUF4253 domain-containing protein n=1 Tax=Streptomyces sp. NRRL F-5123 TaxID=1463856 RepID=UPI000694C5E4|nr:DUF4253 domain-containing protein [Streptomyces sp. NRRL F-5123]